MGNSSSQTSDAEVLDSRVIKISESVAKRLLVQPTMTRGSKVSRNEKAKTVYLPDPPLPSPQAYREDRNYVDDDLFKEFQKQEVLNKLQIQNLRRKMIVAFEPFATECTQLEKMTESDEQKRLAQCFETHENSPLKCHAEVLDFTTYVKQTVNAEIRAMSESDDNPEKLQ